MEPAMSPWERIVAAQVRLEAARVLITRLNADDPRLDTVIAEHRAALAARWQAEQEQALRDP
jgi:hypothetical protein